MFFPSTSLRTRVTFERGASLMGLQPIVFPDTTLDKPEALTDVAQYLAAWADILVVRHHDLAGRRRPGCSSSTARGERDDRREPSLRGAALTCTPYGSEETSRRSATCSWAQTGTSPEPGRKRLGSCSSIWSSAAPPSSLPRVQCGRTTWRPPSDQRTWSSPTAPASTPERSNRSGSPRPCSTSRRQGCYSTRVRPSCAVGRSAPMRSNTLPSSGMLSRPRCCRSSKLVMAHCLELMCVTVGGSDLRGSCSAPTPEH